MIDEYDQAPTSELLFVVRESILSTHSGVDCFEKLSSHPVVKNKVNNNIIDTFVFIVTSAIKLLGSKIILISLLR